MNQTIKKMDTMKQPINGFGLIEMLVTLMILVIIASIAAPAFKSQFESLERQKVCNEIRMWIRQARHLAVTKHQRLVLCGTQDGITCGDANSWHHGWLLFLDSNGNRERDTNEPIEKFKTLNLKYGQLSWNGFGSPEHLVFNGYNGIVSGSQGTFSYCAHNPAHSKKIVISPMGNSRIEDLNCK